MLLSEKALHWIEYCNLFPLPPDAEKEATQAEKCCQTCHQSRGVTISKNAQLFQTGIEMLKKCIMVSELFYCPMALAFAFEKCNKIGPEKILCRDRTRCYITNMYCNSAYRHKKWVAQKKPRVHDNCMDFVSFW